MFFASNYSRVPYLVPNLSSDQNFKTFILFPPKFMLLATIVTWKNVQF